MYRAFSDRPDADRLNLSRDWNDICTCKCEQCGAVGWTKRSPLSRDRRVQRDDLRDKFSPTYY